MVLDSCVAIGLLSLIDALLALQRGFLWRPARDELKAYKQEPSHVPIAFCRH